MGWCVDGRVGGRQDGGVHFFLAPVLICDKPKVTVGLGDAISAAAIGAYFR